MSRTRERPRDRASWDERYVDGDIPWDSGEPDPHLQRVIQERGIEPGRALEVGCGTATNLVWLARRGFDATGVDLAPTAISMAEAKVADAGVEVTLRQLDFLVDEVASAPFDFLYDRGCFHVFDEPGDRSRFAARVGELLAPEGRWCSIIGSTDGPPREHGPPRRSARDVTEAVEPHLEILELRATPFAQGRHGGALAWVLVARRRRW